MNRLALWRWTLCSLCMLMYAAITGCAALDLLGGHVPGEEEDPPPAVDPRPYPSSAATSHKSPSAESAQEAASDAAAPAPIVNASAKTPSVSGEAKQAPARATLSDDPKSAAAPSQPAPTGSGSSTQSSPSATSNTEPAAASVAPPTAPAPASVEKAKTTEAVSAAASPPSATTSAEPAKSEKSATPEPTREQRLADIVRRRNELLAALEAEVKLRSGQSDPDGQLPQMQQQLRLLYLLAERPDEAVSEIESLPDAEQEAFKQLMFGLSTWLSPEEERRARSRNARVLRSLRDASSQLAAAAKLDVRNLRFCESVEGFGWYKEFPAAQFRSKQQVILYAEVDNFATEKKGPDNFETELQASYQIFDSGGTLVDERELPLDKELCRNQRRDYFLAYRIYLPDGLTAGRYRLELTVEDLKAKQDYQGRKLGDATIEFAVR